MKLTKKQARLVAILDDRARCCLPTTQRDLAEEFGIRREALNRLLARTRRRLVAMGRSLPVPPKGRSARARLTRVSERMC